MTQPVLLGALVVLVALSAGLVVALVTALVGQGRRLRTADAAVAELGARLDRLEAAGRREPSAPSVQPVVITGIEPAAVVPPAPPVDGRLLADTVLREAVVRGAGLGHGVRRALTPEVRHHIRLEMRREVKRARKQRRSDLREARRAWAAAGRASGSP